MADATLEIRLVEDGTSGAPAQSAGAPPESTTAPPSQPPTGPSAPRPSPTGPVDPTQPGPAPTSTRGPKDKRAELEKHVADEVADLEDRIQYPKESWRDRRDRQIVRDLQDRGASDEEISRVKALQEQARAGERPEIKQQGGASDVGRTVLDFAAHLSGMSGEMGKFVTAIRQILNTIAMFEALYRSLKKLTPQQDQPQQPSTPPPPTLTPPPPPTAPVSGPEEIVDAEVVPPEPTATSPETAVPGPEPSPTAPGEVAPQAIEDVLGGKQSQEDMRKNQAEGARRYANRIAAGENPEDVLVGVKKDGALWNKVMEEVRKIKDELAAPPTAPASAPVAGPPSTPTAPSIPAAPPSTPTAPVTPPQSLPVTAPVATPPLPPASAVPPPLPSAVPPPLPSAASAVAGPAAAAVPSAPATAAAAGLSKLAAIAGPVGIAVAAIGTVAAVAVVGLKMFGKMIEEEAKKLSLYSGAVAGAVAETEIRELHATLRRTERIGPDVARWESMRGKFSERMMDVNTELLNVVLKFANHFEPLADDALVLLEVIAAAGKMYGTGIAAGLAAMTGAAGSLAVISANAKRLREMKEEERDKTGEGWGQFDQILPWGRGAPFRQPQNPAQRGPRRPLAVNP